MAALLMIVVAQVKGAEVTVRNVSLDTSRELFQQYNKSFAQHWKESAGDTTTINQSHAGSSKQARAVIDSHATKKTGYRRARREKLFLSATAF